MIRVLIADDHAVFRDGLESLLAQVPEITVVGQAADAEAAVRAARDLTPDVVLMDLHMPGDGLEAIAQVDLDTSAVLVLTMHADSDLVRRALQAGARGYLLKDSGAREIVRAIEAVAAGQAIFDPGVSRVIVSGGDPYPFPELTPRERDVLARMIQGLPTTAIAGRLGLTPKTVQNNVSRVLMKLRARDRAHAVAIARGAGLA